ncbi:hypothetical protein C8J57DRAFT_1529582 [Mycena rebaudengoi]|nr:hypothetical protein C8J57DRAFT_1529582 [Mycena rebaudengoi]
MSDNQESLLLPELLAPPTTILVSMGWAMLDYVRYNIARAIPRFLRLQTAFVYPDGDQVKERIWVKVPVMRIKHGTSRGKKIINIDREDGALVRCIIIRFSAFHRLIVANGTEHQFRLLREGFARIS